MQQIDRENDPWEAKGGERGHSKSRKKNPVPSPRTVAFKSSEESSSPPLWQIGLRTDGMVDWSTKVMRGVLVRP